MADRQPIDELEEQLAHGDASVDLVERYVRAALPDQLRRAERTLRKVSNGQRGNVAPFHGLALLAHHQGDRDNLHRAVLEALIRTPDHAPTLALVDPEQAVELRRQAAGIPELARRIDDFIAHTDSLDADSVVAEMRDMVQQHPYYHRAQHFFFSVCQQHKKLKEARRLFDWLSQRSDSTAMLNLHLAKVFEACGDIDACLEHCLWSLQVAPRHMEAAQLAARLVKNDAPRKKQLRRKARKLADSAEDPGGLEHLLGLLTDEKSPQPPPASEAPAEPKPKEKKASEKSKELGAKLAAIIGLKPGGPRGTGSSPVPAKTVEPPVPRESAPPPAPPRPPEAIRFCQHCPAGVLGCNDLFLAVTEGQPLLLLVDGSPGRGSASGSQPRRKLFQILASVWPELRTLEPERLLHRFGEALREENQLSKQEGKPSMFCSAVACSRGAAAGEWLMAEVGDTKAFLVEGEHAVPLWSEGLPTSDHRVDGPLGTSRPSIRSRTLTLAPDQPLLLLTDGAFSVLSAAGCVAPEGIQTSEPASRFDDWVRRHGSEDDATLVVFRPALLPEVSDAREIHQSAPVGQSL
jgi:hypothetical protein